MVHERSRRLFRNQHSDRDNLKYLPPYVVSLRHTQSQVAAEWPLVTVFSLKRGGSKALSRQQLLTVNMKYTRNYS